MTTIVYRKGVLAGDTQVCSNDGKTIIEHTRKVYRLPDGSLYGFSGGLECGLRLLDALRKDNAPPILADINAILIEPDGSVHLYEGNMWFKQRGEYFALGSGESVALAAMDAGADAIKAVQIAIKRDTCTGGRVQHLRLKR